MRANRALRLVLVPALIAGLLGGCSPGERDRAGDRERYTSAAVSGAAEKINLDAVHEAFFATAGKEFTEWMQNFERRVNEIYTGDDLVAIDADKRDGKIRVAGYLDRDGQQGVGPGDEKLFELQQTAAADSRGFQYRLDGHGSQPYYTGYPPPAYHHHGLLDNPFLQLFVLSHLLAPRWSYYTPPARHTVLRNNRTGYRASPRYQAQAKENKGFFKRMVARRGGDLRSSKGFGAQQAGGPDGGARKRSWFGSSGSNDSRWSGRQRDSAGQAGRSTSGSSGWGGRRTSGSSGWGSRRSSGGGRSWGGRRR